MRKVQAIMGIILLSTLFGFVVYHSPNEWIGNAKKGRAVRKERLHGELARLLNDFSYQYSLFRKATVENGRYVYRDKNMTVIFTIEPLFQKRIEKEFKRFKVKYGAYVALDASTGKVLAVVSSTDYPNFAFKRTFPSASTFKIVTTAAALETGIANPDTSFVCGGRDDSCSPSVWLNSPYKQKRKLRDAFAHSCNPFFGNLGRLLGRQRLIKFAKKFGFNRTDYGFPWGFIRNPLDGYDLALTAAGLKETRISPFHEALIALTVTNNGTMLLPSFIEKVYSKGNLVYSFKKKELSRVISPKTAQEIRSMMISTVKYGTVSDKKYFKILKRRYVQMVVGGKSGTLSELTYPEGRCEWFTGFTNFGGKKIAFSSLAINGSKYYISGYELGAVASMDFAKLNSEYAEN